MPTSATKLMVVATGESIAFYRVLNVIFSGSIFQIVRMGIQTIIIFVPALLASRTETQKGRSNKHMNALTFSSAESNSPIPATRTPWTQNSHRAARTATHTPPIGHIIMGVVCSAPNFDSGDEFHRLTKLRKDILWSQIRFLEVGIVLVPHLLRQRIKRVNIAGAERRSRNTIPGAGGEQFDKVRDVPSGVKDFERALAHLSVGAYDVHPLGT